MLATSIASLFFAAAAVAAPAATVQKINYPTPDPEATKAAAGPMNFAAAPPATPYTALKPKDSNDFGIQYWYGGAGDNGRKWCIDVAYRTWNNGAPVWLWECGASNVRNPAQAFERNGDQLRIKGNDKWWCLDAGSNPVNGNNLKLWECLDVPQQKWKDTGKQIKIKNTNLCINVEMGAAAFGTKMQVWECDSNNKNQKWTQAWLGAPYY